MRPMHAAWTSLLLLLCVAIAPALVNAHLFSWLVDWQTVCEPDYVQCPNGGLTFRDRNHDCEFTPCAFIPAPPLPSPPDPKTLTVNKWFGRYEFMVPTLNVVALQRGKAVEREWADAIVAKRDHPIRANFSATIDLYIAAKPSETSSVTSEYASHARDLHLDALVAAQMELFVEENEGSSSSSSSHGGSLAAGMSTPARELAVSTAPWTRWEFFGQLGGSSIPPTLTTLQTALRLLKNKTTAVGATRAGGHFTTLVVEAADEVDIMTSVVAQCDAMLQRSQDIPVSAVSVLVFATDFRTPANAKGPAVSEEMLRPWNLTHVKCDRQPDVSSSTHNVSTTDIRMTLLSRPTNSSRPQEAGGQVNSDTTLAHALATCSCWTRSLVGEPSSANHTTQWMLC